MTFAWYGFALEHPEDWSPVTLSGAREEGYVRVASPGRQSLQIRWKAANRDVDLSPVLDTYLDRLARDAKAARTSFHSHIDAQPERLTYRYSSSIHGRGAILQSAKSGRVFFLEAISSKNDSLLPSFRKLLDSFDEPVLSERWALFGLDVKVPSELEVEKKVLEAGRTVLVLACKNARVEIQRWGFAEQLVAKHGLEQWARAVLSLPKSVAKTSACGVEFTQTSALMRPPVYAIAQVQADRNQITTVKVQTRDEAWRPTWDWLA